MRPRRKGILVVALVLIAGSILFGCGGSGRGNDDGGATGAQAAGSAHVRWMPSLAKRRSVVWAVGDAADGSSTAQQVASLVGSRHIDRLLYLGDVYDSGTSLEFDRNYRPLYGGLGDITAPTIGNHEWPNVATGYVPYWT